MFWLGYVLKLAADMIKRGFRRQVSGFSPLATCVVTENAVHTAGQCGESLQAKPHSAPFKALTREQVFHGQVLRQK